MADFEEPPRLQSQLSAKHSDVPTLVPCLSGQKWSILHCCPANVGWQLLAYTGAVLGGLGRVLSRIQLSERLTTAPPVGDQQSRPSSCLPRPLPNSRTRVAAPTSRPGPSEHWNYAL